MKTNKNLFTHIDSRKMLFYGLSFFLALGLTFQFNGLSDLKINLWQPVGVIVIALIIDLFIFAKVRIKNTIQILLEMILLLIILSLCLLYDPIRVQLYHWLNGFWMTWGKSKGEFVHLYEASESIRIEFILLYGLSLWLGSKGVVRLGSKLLYLGMYLLFYIIPIAMNVAIPLPIGLFYTIVIFVNSFYAGTIKGETKAKRVASPKAWVSWIVLVTCIFALVGGIYALNFGITTPDLIKNTRNRIAEAIENRRYGENPLPDGKFSDMSARNLSEETALTLTMEDPQSTYLKGFVGVTYTDEGWKKQKNPDYYRATDLFYWLKEDGFTPLNQLDLARSKELGIETGAPTTTKVEINNASRKYRYIPYEMTQLTESDNYVSKSYESIVNKGINGESNYGYIAGPTILKDYLKLAQEIIDKNADSKSLYSNDEAHYNHYVYETYRDIPEGPKKIIEEKLGPAKHGGQHAAYALAKNEILTYLFDHVAYDDTAFQKQPNSDFVEQLLTTDKKGYDVHFATLATLMFRHYGIPARYVEGYIVTNENMEEIKPSEPFEIPVSNAHAWVEIYQDGFGWVPVEITPKYISAMDQPQDSLTSSLIEKARQNINQQEEEDQTQEAESPREENETQNYLETILIILGSILLLLMLILAYLIYKGRRNWKQKIALFEHKDRSRAVVEILKETLSMLYRDGLPKKGGSLYHRKKAIGKRFGIETEKDFQFALDTVQASVFGKEVPDEKGYQKTYAFYLRLRKMIMNNQTIFSRFKMFLKGE